MMTFKRPIYFLFAGILGLATFVCQRSVLPYQWLASPSGAVLFQDDFSDPTSGWDRIASDNGIHMDYSQGAYRIQIDGDHRTAWSNPGLEFIDVNVETATRWVDGNGEDDFGLVCRGMDQNNFYFFSISSDGYYGIGKVKDGTLKLLNSQAMMPSEHISQSQDTNHLQAACIGDRLSLTVNGVLLAEVRDADFQRGAVGLIAGTLDEGFTVVDFDNFSVTAP
jgi:hypothetical protein